MRYRRLVPTTGLISLAHIHTHRATRRNTRQTSVDGHVALVKPGRSFAQFPMPSKVPGQLHQEGHRTEHQTSKRCCSADRSHATDPCISGRVRDHLAVLNVTAGKDIVLKDEKGDGRGCTGELSIIKLAFNGVGLSVFDKVGLFFTSNHRRDIYKSYLDNWADNVIVMKASVRRTAIPYPYLQDAAIESPRCSSH